VISGPPLIRLTTVPSTMDALHALGERGAPAGTAVVADVQTAGRGSRGRSWASPAGGLWLSVLARPAVTGLELLSLRAGVAVAEALDRLLMGDRIALKWPNDLMLNDRKAGGLLCEARWQGTAPAWVVIGLGLNVANPPEASLAASATYLGATGRAITPAALIDPLVRALREVDVGSGPLTPAEQARFARRDWLHGRVIERPAAGVADGIAPDGALRIRTADGQVVEARAGTVVLAERTAAPLPD
jgi:BirA family transcriptional regulator, biotin operon repressor / biotin---[acetyl-CoA-carboxylase] ligase